MATLRRICSIFLSFSSFWCFSSKVEGSRLGKSLAQGEGEGEGEGEAEGEGEGEGEGEAEGEA